MTKISIHQKKMNLYIAKLSQFIVVVNIAFNIFHHMTVFL